MKHQKFYPPFLLFMTIFLVQSCQSSDAKLNSSIQKAAFIEILNKNQVAEIGFYDLNNATNKLEWRTIKQTEKEGNKGILELTIATFFKQNQLLKETANLKLDKIVELGTEINITIGGGKVFQSVEEEEILKMALELTIARTINTDQFNISYQFH